MAELFHALDEALAGQGRLAMLAGEPGIGKTRAAQELSNYATSKGARVFWGQCFEDEGAPPYWPWLQIIRGYTRDRSPEDLRNEMGSAAPVIAEIVPEISEALPDLPPLTPTQEPAQARFRLFDSITSFFKNASHAQPIVMILDDLHWSDRSSLMLLEFVSQQIADSQVLILGSYREAEIAQDHPLSDTLGALTRLDGFRRIELDGLIETDVGEFIKITTGSDSSTELNALVHSHTDGNPLFVTEIVRLLAQEGVATTEPEQGFQGWIDQIPPGIREAIGRRLNRLSSECNVITYYWTHPDPRGSFSYRLACAQTNHDP